MKKAVKTAAILAAGGGFNGIIVTGFLKAILEQQFQLIYLGGVSVSALILSKLAESYDEKSFQRIVNVWRTIDKEGSRFVFSKVNLLQLCKVIFPDHYVYSSHSRIENLLKLAEVNFEKIVSSPVIFEISVINLSKQRFHVFSNRNLNPDQLRRAVIASASLPPFFPPIEIEGNLFSDGLIIVPDMIDSAIQRKPDIIFLLLPFDFSKIEEPTLRITTLKNFFIYQSMLDRVYYRELLVHLECRYKIKNRWQRLFSLQRQRPLQIIPISVNFPKNISTSYFQSGCLMKTFNRAYEHAKKILELV